MWLKFSKSVYRLCHGLETSFFHELWKRMKSSPTLAWCALTEQTWTALAAGTRALFFFTSASQRWRVLNAKFLGFGVLPHLAWHTLWRELPEWPNQPCQKTIHSHTQNPDDNWCVLTSLIYGCQKTQKLHSCVCRNNICRKKISLKCFPNPFLIRQLYELSFEALLFLFVFECCFHHEFKWILQDSKESYWTWGKEKRGAHGAETLHILWMQSSEAFIHKSRASHQIGGFDSVSTGMMSYQIFCFLLFIHWNICRSFILLNKSTAQRYATWF